VRVQQLVGLVAAGAVVQEAVLGIQLHHHGIFLRLAGFVQLGIGVGGVDAGLALGHQVKFRSLGLGDDARNGGGNGGHGGGGSGQFQELAAGAVHILAHYRFLLAGFG